MATGAPATAAEASQGDAAVAVGGPSGTQTLVRGLRVLEAMADQERSIGVGELARHLDLPKSTVQRLLRTLEQEGWAQTTAAPVTRWELSPRLSALARRGPADLREVAGPHLTSLGARTGEAIHFTVPDRDVQLILIERVHSIHPVQSVQNIGASTPFHASAGGKAVMARLPDAELDAILARPLDKVMPNTSVDRQQLMHQIMEVRERGYAVNISENREHVCAVGAAVVDTAGRPVAAVVISMPDIRFEPSRVPEWGKWVRDTAEAISAEIAR